MQQSRFNFVRDSSDQLAGLTLGYLIFSGVRNGSPNVMVGEAIDDALRLVKKRHLSLNEISNDPVIKGVRVLFSTVGIDPTKERPSGEALIRRVVSGSGLYRINPVVDINNIISLLCGCPCGVYDSDKLVGDRITVFVGGLDVRYQGISGKSINGDHRILTRDAEGVFGGPVADSKRTSVTATTENLLMLIYFPASEFTEEKMKRQLEDAAELMLACCGGALIGSGLS